MKFSKSKFKKALEYFANEWLVSVIVVVVIAAIITFISVNYKVKANTVTTQKTVEEIYSDKFGVRDGIRIIRDNETGIEYIIIDFANGVAVYPRLKTLEGY